MKILHLITGLSTGGAEKMLYQVLRFMDRKEFRSLVISLSGDGAVGEEIKKLGIPVRTLSMNYGLSGILGFSKLLVAIREERPDMLQTWLYHADLMGLLSGKRTGISPIVWNIRCSNMEMKNYSVFSSLTLKLCARLSHWPDAVIVNSLAGERIHEQIGYRPKKWRYIPNGIDPELFKPALEAKSGFRAQYQLPADAFLVGMVARFDPMKDHETVLAAAEIVLRDFPNAYFIFIGKGMEEGNEKLMNLMKKRGSQSSVLLLGERRDVQEIMPAFDVVASSSYGEGFPNVIGEAMSCGVPCVATDVGDMSHIIKDTGIVVPPKSPEALAEGIMKMIDIGPETRKMMGEKARERIKAHYDIRMIAKQYEDFYRELASCAG